MAFGQNTNVLYYTSSTSFLKFASNEKMFKIKLEIICTLKIWKYL